MKIVMQLLNDAGDGVDTVEVDALEATFMCLADRVAFQQAFGTNPATMASWQALFDADGNPLDDADLGQLDERFLAFFAWREARRRTNGQLDAYGGDTFDGFIERLADLEIDTDVPTSG